MVGKADRSAMIALTIGASAMLAIVAAWSTVAFPQGWSLLTGSIGAILAGFGHTLQRGLVLLGGLFSFATFDVRIRLLAGQTTLALAFMGAAAVFAVRGRPTAMMPAVRVAAKVILGVAVLLAVLEVINITVDPRTTFSDFAGTVGVFAVLSFIVAVLFGAHLVQMYQAAGSQYFAILTVYFMVYGGQAHLLSRSTYFAGSDPVGPGAMLAGCSIVAFYTATFIFFRKESEPAIPADKMKIWNDGVARKVRSIVTRADKQVTRGDIGTLTLYSQSPEKYAVDYGEGRTVLYSADQLDQLEQVM